MSDLPPTKRDSAGVRFPPPILGLIPFLIGLSFDRHLTRLQPPALPSRVLGAILACAGLALSASAIGLFRRNRTSLRTDRTSNTLVIEGPYRFTRNPIYVGFVTLYLGVALLLRAPGALLLWPVAIVLFQTVVIRREERYLARRFGDRYLSYQAHVRRWI